MASKQGQVNADTGRVETRHVKRARPGDFDRANPNTRAKRAIRALVH